MRTVATADVHPFYDPISVDYDVAVLKLQTPLSFNSFVQPIPLPAFGQEVDKKLEGTISGWGMTRVSFVHLCYQRRLTQTNFSSMDVLLVRYKPLMFQSSIGVCVSPFTMI